MTERPLSESLQDILEAITNLDSFIFPGYEAPASEGG